MSLCQYFVFVFLASPCLGTTRVHSFTSAEEQKTSCFDHENCLSRAKEKPRREDEESVKSRAVSDIWNSHIGDLRWAQPLQDQQGDRRILIPLDFMGDNLVAGKACRLQRSPLLSALATAGLLWTRRVETGRTSTICKCNKRANIDINSCHCCLCRWVHFLLLLLHPVKGCKKVNHVMKFFLNQKAVMFFRQSIF